jgi:hypothetical protein
MLLQVRLIERRGPRPAEDSLETSDVTLGLMAIRDIIGVGLGGMFRFVFETPCERWQ